MNSFLAVAVAWANTNCPARTCLFSSSHEADVDPATTAAAAVHHYHLKTTSLFGNKVCIHLANLSFIT